MITITSIPSDIDYGDIIYRILEGTIIQEDTENLFSKIRFKAFRILRGTIGHVRHFYVSESRREEWDINVRNMQWLVYPLGTKYAKIYGNPLTKYPRFNDEKSAMNAFYYGIQEFLKEYE